MKISLISTVFQEENNILTFLKSIVKQTKRPDEVVLVDAGSSDNTLSLMRNFAKTSPFLLKIIVKEGNRSVGRNEAIKLARNEIIAVSDVGCILDKEWLENITHPFSGNQVDVVAGFYKPVAHTVFEQCLATYTSVMEDKIDENFLPSSRSVAFRKAVWEKVGGYPKELDTCEDLVFSRRLKKKGYVFSVEKNAVVFWPQRKNIKEAFVQFYGYAVGDGQARYFRKQTPFLFLRAALGIYLLSGLLLKPSLPYLLFLLFLFLLYSLWAIWKNYKYVKHWEATIFLPLLQITSDIAVPLGMLYGLVKKRPQ